MDKLKHQTLLLTCIPAVILALVLIMLVPLMVVDTNTSQTGQAIGIINPPEITAPTVDPTEIDLVCKVVAAEARGESLAGQMAVAQVICDRAELRGMSLTEVVSQPDQFAGSYKGEISDLTREAVHRVLIDGERVFDQQITHFASNKPWWSKGMTVAGEIGGHKFYKEEQT